jgi:hypothetical protein
VFNIGGNNIINTIILEVKSKNMKSIDLRLGNYVYYEHTTHIVSGLHGNKVYSWWVKNGEPVIEYEDKDIGGAQVENPYMDVISRYEPITLTDEWFEKWKFYKDGEYWCRGINDYKFCFKYRDWAKNWSFYQEFTDSPNEHDDGVKYPISFDIEFVHQLQNLWYSLLHTEICWDLN